jgi:hypothetical protein
MKSIVRTRIRIIVETSAAIFTQTLVAVATVHILLHKLRIYIYGLSFVLFKKTGKTLT